MSKNPMIILIAGGTCAGKSTLCKKIADCFPKNDVYFMSSDDFVNLKIKGKTTDVEIISEGQGMDEKQVKEFNENHELRTEMELRWNNPENVDWKKLVDKTKKYITSSPQTQKIILIEGLHALQNEELRKMADLKIYSDTSEDLRLMFKIIRSPWYKKMIGEKPRDTRDFGGSVNPLPNALEAWQKGVKPGELQYVIPTKHYADIIITYNSNIDLVKNVNSLHTLITLYLEKPEEFQKKMRTIREQRWKEGAFAEEPQKPRIYFQTKNNLPATNYLPWIISGLLIISIITWLLIFWLVSRKKAK